MAYGKIKVDTITYDNSGVDQDVSVSDLAGAGSAAPLADPHFTGTPETPTPNAGDNSNRIASTAWVTTELSTNLAGAALTNLNTTDANGNPVVTPPTAPTVAQVDAGSTAIATTQYVKDAVGALVDNAPTALNTLNELAAAIGDSVDANGLADAIATKLPLAGGTLTGALTVNDTVSCTEALKIERVIEKANLTGTAATGTINLQVKNEVVHYANADATGNYVLNITGETSTPTTLDSMLGVGEALTNVFVTNNGSTAYYPTSVTVDSASPASIKWIGGAPTTGTANSITAYTLTVIKTASQQFTVLANKAEYVS